MSKRGRDTESDANIQPEEMLTFFSNEFPSAFPHEIPKCVSCNITYHFKEIFAYCDNFLYFAHRCAKRCTKILKLSFAVRTLLIACSKLGKTRTIADVRTAWLETAGFAIESRLPATGRTRRISPAAVIIYQSARFLPRRAV